MLIFWVSTVSIPKDRFAFDVDRGYIGLNIEWYFMDKLCITGNKRILLEYITVRTKKENLILNKFMFYLSISFSFSLYMSLFFLFPLCLSPSLVSHFLSVSLSLTFSSPVSLSLQVGKGFTVIFHVRMVTMVMDAAGYVTVGMEHLVTQWLGSVNAPQDGYSPHVLQLAMWVVHGGTSGMITRDNNFLFVNRRWFNI